MDGSGGNRYELLYMDDDAGDPLDSLVKKSKAKQPQAANPGNKQKNAGGVATAAAAPGKQINQPQIGGKKGSNLGIGGGGTGGSAVGGGGGGGGGGGAEKENKSSAMNKNVEKKTVPGHGQGTGNPGGPGGPNSTSGGPGQKQKGPPGPAGGQFKDQTNHRNNQDQRQPREGYKNDRNVNFKQQQNQQQQQQQQNGETREQRNNRRNRDEQRPQQQQQHQHQQYASQFQQSSQQQNGSIAPGDYQQSNERPQRQRGPPRRNFEGGRGGKREFDRQSGSDKTGVKAIDKRDGAGAHNWGSPKQDIEDLNKSHEDVLIDKDDSTGEQQIEQQVANVEEETKELTLDEWKAQRAVRAKPQFNIRKAGEGEDLSQWKKMIALNNKKRDEDSEEELEYDPSMYPQRVGRLQRVLDIEFHFNDGRRGGGVGRGRGRSRGQGGAGGGGGGPVGGGGRQGRVPRNIEPKHFLQDGIERQQRGGQNAPKVDDEHDFPSLG